MILAVLAQHHRGPTGWLLGALIVLAILYLGWRRGRARRPNGLAGLTGLARLRAEFRELRIGPLTLLPLALLVIVVVVLLIAH